MEITGIAIKGGNAMNLYTQIIAEGLEIDFESAEKIQTFISRWFDDFRFGSSSKWQIVATAYSAQKWMDDPRFAVVEGQE